MKHYTHPVAPAVALALTGVAAAWAGTGPVDPAPPAFGTAPAPAAHAPAPPAAQSAAGGTATRSVGSPRRGAPRSGPAAAAWGLADDVVRRYCVRCHSDERVRGNLTLESFSLEEADERVEVAEKMIRKLRAGMMPPPGARRPSPDTLAALLETLEARMDELAAADPNPGYRAFQRLNRAEYRAAVKDLLGVDVDAGAFLPPDTKSANFDNIADAQTPSATLMEGYLRAAWQVARDALGDPGADATSVPYRVPRTAAQLERVEGAPFGTRGGISVVHNFPADGKYVFRVMLHQAPEGELFGRSQHGERVEVSVDGERVAHLDIDRWMTGSDPAGTTMTTDSIHVRAGPRRVTAAFVKRIDGPVDDLVTPIEHTLADTQIGLDYGITALPHLQLFTIQGPYEPTGVSDTPTRRLVFTCRPTAPEEARPCAREIVTRLATGAYRRPLEPSDVEGLMGFYDQGAAAGGFEAGVRTALQAILASPHFLFRAERADGKVRDGLYRIADEDLASRLSFFLWGTLPDAELIDVAAEGELSRPAALRAQARRMLADERSRALSTRFAAQWLRLSDLDKVHPDALDYPYYDHTLAEAMKRETELLFERIVREDRSVLELLSADYTHLNERLSRHYGFGGVTGEDFQVVRYPDGRRRGLLGHGSVLTSTSHANRTSPVLRGKWIMEVILGSPPPPPPPDVPDLEATEGVEEGRVLSVRERMEQHRSNPTCNSCHRTIDPLGLALENFDVTGAWRLRDEGNPVDPVGEMYDGTRLAGPSDLHQALLTRPEVFLATFTENLMAYALGRRVEYYDQPTVRAIIRRAEKDGYPMSAFVLGVVESQAFRLARAPVAAADGVDGASDRQP